MMNHMVAVAMLLGGRPSAQDIAGDWQGKSETWDNRTARRHQTSLKTAKGAWTATESTPDGGIQWCRGQFRHLRGLDS